MTARVRRDAIRDRVRDRRRRVAVLAGLHELLAGGGGAGRTVDGWNGPPRLNQ